MQEPRWRINVPPKSTNSPELHEAETLLSAAAVWLEASNPAAAIAPLSAAANLRRQDCGLHHDLGLACLEAGQPSEAVAAFQKAIAIKPRYPEAYFRMAIAMESLNDFRGAVTAYDQATALKPNYAEAWFRAGALVHTLGHRTEAIACFRRAKLSGKTTEIGLLAEARALITEERDAEAEQLLRKILVQYPKNAMAHDLLGGLLSESGHFEEARVCFARAIDIAPSLAGSYYELVRCRKITEADEVLVTQMQEALSSTVLGSEQRLRVHLAIGKAAEDLGRFEFAMEHFNSAESLRRDRVKFNSQHFANEIDRLIELCSPELMSKAKALGSSTSRPVFIIGMPRSGTTLIEKIIASHSLVAAGGERNFWNARGARWLATAKLEDADFMAEAAVDYLADLKTVSSNAARVTDKMPFNFLWAGLIHLAFPNATIIHCEREPVDTSVSIHQTYFHPTLAFPTGGDDLVKYFKSYVKITDHWRKVLPQDRFITCDYEELTREPEPTIRKIIAACGLPWEDTCLAPDRSPSWVKTPSKWQIRQPIYRSSVAKWKNYQPWLGPLADLIKN
jgi:tetratricopeptide (TPR) repeat protein